MAISASDRKELVSYFGKIDADNDDVLLKLISLKDIFNLDAQDLFIKWEQHVNRAGTDLDVNTVNVDDFQKYLQSSISTSSKSTPSMKKSRDAQGSIRKRQILKSTTGFSSSPVSTVPVTPVVKKRKVDGIESSPVTFETANNTLVSSSPQNSPAKPESTPFLSRLQSQQKSNTILETLNPHLEEVPGYVQLDDVSTSAPKPFKLVLNFDTQKFKFRTMAMKLLESADVLDEQIDLMAQTYSDAHTEHGRIEFGNPCLSSQSDIVCCGRIVPDSPLYDKAVNPNLNATSLFLETSRLGGIGQRIPLDLSHLQEYGLFPGQVVVLRGRNPTGRKFIVQEVLDLPDMAVPLTNQNELEEYENLVGSNGLKMLIASGPFSNQHTLDHRKLQDLVERINSDIKPHVVVLYGPFIDINNYSVSSGEIHIPDEKSQPKSLDDVFKMLITPILKKINPKIQVVLIPSLKDTCIKHVSYPQDSFDRKKLGLPKNVRVVPNPSSFSINEVLIGGSNLDVFKDLRDVYKAAPHGGKIPANRFDRIVNYIFEQRRYYPTFPGSIKKKREPLKSDLYNGSMAEELAETDIGGSSLEVPYMGLAELGETLPDILIVPSELKSFAKSIKGVTVINPGQFIKPNRDPLKEAGSYVVMSIKAPSVSDPDNGVQKVQDDLYYHNISQRSRVDIYSS